MLEMMFDLTLKKKMSTKIDQHDHQQFSIWICLLQRS